MKRTNLFIGLLMGTLLLMSSCVSQQKFSSTFFKPDRIRLELSMQDMTYLGDVTVSVTYKRYFGIFVKTLQINGDNYNPRYQQKARFALNANIGCDPRLKKALYKVQEVYPDADYIIPASFNETVDKMIGGRIVTEQMRVKVYKLK